MASPKSPHFLRPVLESFVGGPPKPFSAKTVSLPFVRFWKWGCWDAFWVLGVPEAPSNPIHIFQSTFAMHARLVSKHWL